MVGCGRLVGKGEEELRNREESQLQVARGRPSGTGAVNRYRTYGTAATGSVLERKTAKYRFRDQRCNYSRSRAVLLKDNEGL